VFDWGGKRGSEKGGGGSEFDGKLLIYPLPIHRDSLFFFFFVLSFSRLLCLGFLYKLLVFFLIYIFFLILWVLE